MGVCDSCHLYLPALIISTGDTLLFFGIVAPRSPSCLLSPTRTTPFFSPLTPFWPVSPTRPCSQSVPSCPQAIGVPSREPVAWRATHREGQQELPAEGSAPATCGWGRRHRTRDRSPAQAPGGRSGRARRGEGPRARRWLGWLLRRSARRSRWRAERDALLDFSEASASHSRGFSSGGGRGSRCVRKTPIRPSLLFS